MFALLKLYLGWRGTSTVTEVSNSTSHSPSSLAPNFSRLTFACLMLVSGSCETISVRLWNLKRYCFSVHPQMGAENDPY